MRRDELRFRVASWFGAAFLRALGRTLRVRVEGDEPLRELRHRGQPVVFVLWHSRILPLAYLHRNEGVVVLISEHGDGEYIARTVERLGFSTARGSSTRGGVRGLRGLLRAARSGRDLALTPDGPRGPARKFKAGALIAAQLSGARVIPVTVGGPSMWRVGSWDRLVIPKPFSRLTLRYEAPRAIPRDATEEELDRHATELEQLLNRITEEVDGGGQGETSPSERSLPASEGRSGSPR